ncbi:type I polyketide synthase [Vineibacter terrae]|uniref:type I polyketide synthase n=1 Tax=Vineibacter terrae TaxID=2586908 RepID=UPI0015B6E0DB|nr:type I polyketide synthase [Vineibacter terrae]
MRKKSDRGSKQRQIGIIGYALRVPGAPDREAFWRMLSEGRCAVTRVPADRFPLGAFYHPKASADIPGRSYTFAAGVLDDVWSFDPTVFGISPREAAQMDPQQRHLLQVVYEAIEHAGLRPSQLAGSRTGVYVGASSSDYATRFMFDPSAVDVHMMTGNTLSIISNRISYCFDLRGPSFTVDTACSSSLVAMHVALEAIRDGKIDTAIVGGVNLLLSPFSFVGFSRASMLSPTGLCKAFDASGDGYVRAEGALAVVLRASDVAARNGDRVHATIVGSGINQDGRTTGLSLPSPDAQAALLQQVYAEFGVAPDELAFIEAHGTGTRVGDPAEAEALGTILGQKRTAPLPIGSVKTNIGHLEPGSGLAGVIKSVMALKEGVLPPSLHFNEPNPDIRFEELNLKVAAEPTKLAKGRGLRHAGINSFGFGGANAHVVLREPDRAPAAARPKANGAAPAPLVLSAYGADALKALADRYASRLPKNGHADVTAIANAAAHTRDLLPERMVVAGSNLRASLTAHVNGEAVPSLWRGKALGSDLDIGFVFAGNGTQWAGMGLAAYQGNAAFREALQAFDARFKELAGWSTIEALQSPELAVDIRRASRAQPLILALQVAAVGALAARGLEPTLAIGHSVGEIGAAWCAGALDLDGAIRVVLARSQLQEITRYQGGMAAVLVSATEMQALLERQAFDGLEVAAINSARSVTVAGPNAALDAFVKYAEQERWGVRRLDLDYPFHCALVDPIRDRLLAELASIKPSATRIPLISTVTGEEIDGETLTAEYWWRNVRRPVAFEAGLRAVCQRGVRIFVEISARQVLGGYLNDVLRRQSIDGAVIDTLGRDGKEPGDEITATVARVLVAGGRVDLERFVGPAVRPAAELPNYAWQRRQIDFPDTGEAFRTYAAQPHPLLGSAMRAESREWFTAIDPGLFPWLEDHRVEDTAVFPAAGFIEIALAAARETYGDGALEVRDLEILQPLVFDAERSFEVMTRVSHDTGVLEIRSRPRPGEDEWSLHVKATVAQAPVSEMSVAPLSDPACDVFDAERVYALARRRGLVYGPAFRKVESIDVVDDRRARGTFVSARPIAENLLLDPTILDSAFHVSFALAEMDADLAPDARFLPVRIGALRIFRPGTPIASGMCRITLATARSRVADFVLFDSAGNVVVQATQVRFRTVPRAVRETMDSLTYRTGFVRLPERGQPSAAVAVHAGGPATVLADAARAVDDVEAARDVSLVLDVGARAAAYLSLKTVMGEAPTTVPELVASGRVSMSAWPLMARMLTELSDAGLAFETDDGWTLKDAPDFPTMSELVNVLLTRYPAWIAEATCLARLPEILPQLLREGFDAGGYGQAVLEHLENGSPSALRLGDVVQRTASDIIARWPAESPLRVLVVGAVNLPMAARLAPAVVARHGRLVATDMDGERLKTAQLNLSDAASAQMHLVEWDEALDAAGGGYDLVLCAGALHRVAVAPGKLDFLAQAIRQGGTVVAAEPSPSFFADIVHGQRAAWWVGSVNPDFPVGAVLGERDWQQALESAGLKTVTVQSLGGEPAAGLLVSGVASGRSAVLDLPRDVGARSMIVVADASSDSHVLADLLQSRLAGTGRVVPLRSSDGAQPPRGSTRRVRVIDLRESEAAAGAIADLGADAAITDIIFVAADRAPPADPVASLSRKSIAMINLAQAVESAGTVRLWIVCTGALSGAVEGAAPNPTQTGLWAAARVLQNEFPGVEVRCLDVDPGMATDLAASRVSEAITHIPTERELRLSAKGRVALRVLRGGVLPEPGLGVVGADTALRLVIDRAGQGDGFVWRPVTRRAPAAHEVEVKVSATGLNFRDVMWSLGLLPDEALENGFTGPTIGMECAGVVTAVGAEVKNLRVGERVVAFAADAFSTHVSVGAHTVASIPEGISMEAAATLPVAFLTAYYALVHLARLEVGETVLIHGGAGGVGLAALQIAKLRGAKVIATAGSSDRRTLLRELGADHVLDSRSLAFVDDVRRLTQGEGVDVVLNSLAAEAMERSVDCLKPFGRFLELGKRDYYTNRHLGLRPFRNNLSYFGIDADQLLNVNRGIVERLFGELMALFARGELVPLPYRIFESDDAAKAFRLMQRSGHIGKILVRPPQSLPQPDVARQFQVDPKGRYLIVGGLGGFGLATAQWLADKGARHLVLMSRSGKPTEQAELVLAGFKEKGVRVDVVAVDVADRAALERYLTSLQGDKTPLKGVFHVAMVLDDALGKDLDRSRMEAVLRPKVAGADNLDQLTRRFDLDCFVLFSSATVLIGNPGQTNYVAANAFLEGLAQRRRAEGLPGLAVSWGAIGDVGYLARNASVNRALSQRLGSTTLAASEALAGLDQLLARDGRDVAAAALGYARIDWSLARKELVITRTPLFEELQLTDATADGASMAAEELLRMLRDLPEAEVQDKLADLVVANITRTLRLPSGDVDRNRALSEFGMDSLMMLELRTAVEEAMGIEIPLMSLTSSLTVIDISKRLASMLRNQEKALMSGQMSALAQGHVSVPDMASDAEIAAAAAAVAQRAKTVDGVL